MNKKSCYIYTRVSTAAQIDGFSLEAQAERLREYAEYKGLEIAGEYCDAGKSGKSIKGRPEFMRMLDDVASQKDGISFVLVFKLSRFGRNAGDVLKSLQLLMDFGVDLVCVEDAIDSSTQGGRLTLAILSAAAEIEKENIAIQFLAGKMQKLINGGWPGGPIPYGYRSGDKKLMAEPEEMNVVRLIYDLYLKEDSSICSVTGYLNRNGYRKKVRGKERVFTTESVRDILDNPVYCGRILYNRRSGIQPGGRKKEIISAEGMHEPAVTAEQWEAVQEKRAQRKGMNRKADNPDRISLLSGLVKCPVCGRGMVAKKNKGVNHNHGGYYKTLYYYGCIDNLKQNGKACPFSHTYNQEKVDSAVFEIVSHLQALPEFRQEVARCLGGQEEEAALEREIGALRKCLRSEELKRRKLGDDMDCLDIFDHEYDRKCEGIQAEMDLVYDRIEGFEADIARKQRKLSAVRQGIRSADKLRMLLDHMGRLYAHMSCGEIRKLYRLFIDRIDVFPECRDGRIIRSIRFRFPVFYETDNIMEDRTPDEQIIFELDCGRLEITAAEAKASYPQIREYVLEKFGARVSALNIAQIKRKYGIDMRKCYNKPDRPKSRVPRCPRAKEEYILDALKHYKMLGADGEMKEEGGERNEA